MSWVAWGVAAGLAWLVVAVVVSLALGRRLKQQAPVELDGERVPAKQGFYEDDEDPEDIAALFEALRQERP